jgi:peptide-methionine (S)-S-oxide reductase
MSYKSLLAPLFALSGLVAACGSVAPSTTTAASTSSEQSAPATPANTAKAIFAGGCFWCMEKPFDELDGVIATLSGYSGGRVADPTYELVGAGGTGHYEVVEVTYDPAKVSYSQLLDVYWRQVDPYDDRGQFCDKGESYRPAIFVATPEEEAAALASKQRVEASLQRSVVVPIKPARTFYAAEEYHQDYYKKNPVRYAYYRNGCGRDARLRAVWGAK